MKEILTFLFLILISNCISAGSLEYIVKLYNKDGKPNTEIKLVLVETSTFETKKFSPNQNGIYNISISNGEEWVMHVGEMRNHSYFDLTRGRTQGGESIIYDVDKWKRFTKKPINRSKLNLTELIQTCKPNDDGGNSHGIVTISVKQKQGKAWSKMKVNMVSYENKKIYTAITNSRGQASFKVPYHTSYYIDVDEEKEFHYFEVTDFQNSKINLTFEKIKFEETTDSEGYVQQDFLEPPKATSSRIYAELKIRGGSKNGINETVYLESSYRGITYKAITDDKGIARFLLPKKSPYIVHFPYQKDADVLDVSRMRGIARFRGKFKYNPDPRLEFPENYLPTTDFIKSYNINHRLIKNYSKPSGENLVKVQAVWGNKKINFYSKEAILELGISAKAPENIKKTIKRKNLSLVLDKSGSMSGPNFDAMMLQVKNLIPKLNPEDYLSIILFDSQAKILLPQTNNVKVKNLIDLLDVVQAGGMTNIFEGITKGFNEVDKFYKKDYLNKIILLTDGYGSTSIEKLVEVSKIYYEKGISISCIGVGSRYNSALLTTLSQYSNGLNHHVMEPGDIADAFNREMESLNYPIASDLTIEVIYNDKIIYKTLIGFPESKLNQKSVEFKVHQVYPSLNKIALIKFKLDHPNQKIENEKIIIKTSYFDEHKQKQVTRNQKLGLEWSEESELELIIEKEVKGLFQLAILNQKMKELVDLCVLKKYALAKQKNTELTLFTKELGSVLTLEELSILNAQLQGFASALDLVLKKGN